MAKKLKYFKVATEGQTVDGRLIEKQHIQDIAETYDAQNYGARVFMEHQRDLSPYSIYGAYGDVLDVKTETNKEGELVLLAAIDPTAELVQLNKARQKVYTSIEMKPLDRTGGKFYLMGLAVTDSPASWGTEMLKFSISKQPDQTNLFSAYLETALEFSEEIPQESKEMEGFFADLRKKLQFTKEPEKPKQEVISEENKQLFSSLDKLLSFSEIQATTLETFKQQHHELQKDHDELKAQFKTLNQTLENTPENSYRQRSPATGGFSEETIDC